MRPELYTPEDRDFVNLLALKNLSKNWRPWKILKTVKINFFDAIIYSVMFYKSNGEIIDKNKIVEVLQEHFYNDLLEIKNEIKLWIGHSLDISTNVLLPIKFLPSIIFFLNFLNDKISSSFLSKKRYREKMKSQETFRALSVKSFEKGKYHISDRVVKQCHYCEHFFAQNNEAMKKTFAFLCCKGRNNLCFW